MNLISDDDLRKARSHEVDTDAYSAEHWADTVYSWYKDMMQS